MIEVYLALALVLALFVISSSIISAVISLIITIVIVSFVLFELNINYVAMVYLLVYVGAILILLIFVVLASPLDEEHLYKRNNSILPIGLLLSLGLIVFDSNLLLDYLNGVPLDLLSSLGLPEISTTEQSLAQEFYSSNVMPLITVSILLFIAIVGSIGLVL